MLFKYYFCYGSLLLLAIATVLVFVCLLVILDCQGGLSCVPLVSFMNFFFFFFDNENYYQCFYTCIYW